MRSISRLELLIGRKTIVITKGKSVFIWKEPNLVQLRHTHITMRLKAGVPVATIAANTDTGLKYIEQHYFHYRVEEATGQLSTGRRLKPALTDLKRLDDPIIKQRVGRGNHVIPWWTTEELSHNRGLERSLLSLLISQRRFVSWWFYEAVHHLQTISSRDNQEWS